MKPAETEFQPSALGKVLCKGHSTCVPTHLGLDPGSATNYFVTLGKLFDIPGPQFLHL